MQKCDYQDQAIALLQQLGTARNRDFVSRGIPRVVLSRLTASGQVERIERGIYRLPSSPSSEYESLISVALKVPDAVFCLLTALQFHEITTQLPRQIWIARPRGCHIPRMDYPPIKLVQVPNDIHSEGVEEHVRDGVKLRIYSIAQTVADCFKHRSKIGLDVALEALKEVRAKGRASMDDLWRFAKLHRVANVMRPYLEVLG